ncbi:MAG: Hpt domain-containing protein [Alphaproteobacteria bacterium]|nr:Hpt domain-containing protein [Alphaproteobacteria bacterium]
MQDDRFLSQLRVEFLDAAGDQLDGLEATLNAALDGRRTGREALRDVRRSAHTLKGTAGSLGFPLAGAIAHRLEDYLCDADELDPALSRGIMVFCDRIREIAAAGREPSDGDAVQLVRGLPVRWDPGSEEIEALDVEVLLASPSRVASKIVRNTLQNCGYRVAYAETALDVFTLALQIRPDAMILAQTLDQLSGAELARAFKAMSSTAAVPIGLLTSFGPDHAAFQELPDGVQLVRTGRAYFDDDMGGFLTRLQANLA